MPLLPVSLPRLLSTFQSSRSFLCPMSPSFPLSTFCSFLFYYFFLSLMIFYLGGVFIFIISVKNNVLSKVILYENDILSLQKRKWKQQCLWIIHQNTFAKVKVLNVSTEKSKYSYKRKSVWRNLIVTKLIWSESMLGDHTESMYPWGIFLKCTKNIRPVNSRTKTTTSHIIIKINIKIIQPSILSYKMFTELLKQPLNKKES